MPNYKNPDKILDGIIDREHLGEIIHDLKQDNAYLLARVNQLEIIIYKLWKSEELGTGNLNTVYGIIQKEKSKRRKRR